MKRGVGEAGCGANPNLGEPQCGVKPDLEKIRWGTSPELGEVTRGVNPDAGRPQMREKIDGGGQTHTWADSDVGVNPELGEARCVQIQMWGDPRRGRARPGCDGSAAAALPPGSPRIPPHPPPWRCRCHGYGHASLAELHPPLHPSEPWGRGRHRCPPAAATPPPSPPLPAPKPAAEPSPELAQSGWGRGAAEPLPFRP